MTRKVYGVASLPNYADHIRPILAAVPPWARGDLYVTKPFVAPDDGVPFDTRNLPDDAVWLIASYNDRKRLHDAQAQGPYAYLEHGAGQTYRGDPDGKGESASYAGGDGFSDAAVVLVPGPEAYERWNDRYQDRIPVWMIGCPKLDRFHLRPRAIKRPATVAITFHWDLNMLPETRSALRHYQPWLKPLREQIEAEGGQLLGHSHPRYWRHTKKIYDALRIEAVERFDDVLERADVLAADNTSAMYEFASLGRPVIVMNAPWYRRDVEHGLRFWSHIPGLQVDDGPMLLRAVRWAAEDPAELVDLRNRAVRRVYMACDGHAARRGASALMEIV